MNKGRIEKSIKDNADMEKINALSRRELSEDEVYIFTLRLCDNEVDRDYECFSVQSLNELAVLFKGKTGIFDHSMKSADQKARIFDSYVEKQEGQTTLYGDALYALKAKAYMLRSEKNAELISEIDAGIKKEVSVSCSVEKSVCSVCGKDRKLQPCEHRNGKSYKGKLCYTILDGAKDAYEFSFVAVPAQKNAGVTKSFTINEEKNMEDTVKLIKACEGGVELSEKQSASLKSYIEKLEDDAALGEEYKRDMQKDVVRLMSLKLPELDREIISSVTSVMTAKELKAFKNCFDKGGNVSQPQLISNEKAAEKNDYSHFRI